MTSSNYSRIQNTQINNADLVEPITSVLLGGKDIMFRNVDSSRGEVEIVLTPAQWKQACVSLVIIENIRGSSDIHLTSASNSITESDDALLALALHNALDLEQDGAAVTMQFVRAGEGSSKIKMNNVVIMNETTTFAFILVQAVRTRGFYIETKIVPLLVK